MADPEAQALASSPPPSYDSIFGELQAKKTQSSGVVDYAKGATEVCCGKVAGVTAIAIAVILFLAFGLALPIAEIVIGSMYLYDCPAQRYLTIYLIVMGVFSILSGCTGGGSKAANRGESEEGESNSKNAAGSCCNSLIGLFLTAWFICGTAWVFGMEECQSSADAVDSSLDCYTTNSTFSGSHKYCYPLVYGFVYWEIIVKWILLGALVLVSCLCCSVMCCVYCCTSKNEETA